MKRVLAFGLAGFAGFLFAVVGIGVILHLQPIRAGVPPQQGGTGDVNGDGALDISDAVYILHFLFKGGDGPVACGDSRSLTARLDAIEESLRASRSLCFERSDRFVDHADGTVLDACTGLMWQSGAADISANGVIDECDRVSLDGANAYAGSLTLAGHSDWRVPTFQEILSLVDESRVFPAANPVFRNLYLVLPPCDANLSYLNGFWSTTKTPADDALGIEFLLGQKTFMTTSGRLFVLAVRGPVAP